MNPILRFSAVDKWFGRRQVLAGIDAHLGPQLKVAVHGPNGSGKTTLLRLAAGVSPATRGVVTLAGRDLRRETAPAGDLAYVGQETPAFPDLSPLEQLAWWSRLHGAATDDLDRVLAEVGLSRQATLPAGELSRGQRQRLALAIAFHLQPCLLVLDEPTTALDADARQWLGERLRRHPGAALVAVHDEAPWATQEWHLRGGRLEVTP